MTTPRLRVVVVVADPGDASFAVRVLEDNGDRAEVCSDVPEALARLSQETFDLALVSMSLPRGDGLALVHHLRALYPALDVVVISRADEVEEAASAMALGVMSTVIAPLTGDEILVAADRARERRMLIAERAKLTATVASSARRTETYARCAAFVAESELSAVAERVLEACGGELDTIARGLYLLETSGGERYYRAAFAGKPGVLREQLTARDIHVESGETLGLRDGELQLVLLSGHAPIGVIVLARASCEPLTNQTREPLEVIARLASATVMAARRVDAIARGGIKDPETGAYTFAYFGDVAAREIERATRHHRPFALLTLRFGGMAEVGASLSFGELSLLRKSITAGVLAAVRTSDVVARIDDDEYYLLLSETGLLGALSCRRRILERLKGLPADLAGSASALSSQVSLAEFSTSIGISVFPADGVELGTLLKLSRKRSERAQVSAWQQLGLEGLGFWEITDVLFSDAGKALEDDQLCARTRLDPELLSHIATSFVRDAERDAVAGTMYVAGDSTTSAQLSRAVASSSNLSLRTWLLGPALSVRDPASEIRLPLTDSRLKQTSFVLCITERGGYCLASRRGPSGEMLAVHSSDIELVEGLVHALQSTYHLQPELR